VLEALGHLRLVSNHSNVEQNIQSDSANLSSKWSERSDGKEKRCEKRSHGKDHVSRYLSVGDPNVTLSWSR
jgi:hypothetical protein